MTVQTESVRILHRSAHHPLSSLDKDILRVLLYFDIFRYPLKVEEIYRFLPSNSTSPEEIERHCRSCPLRDLVASEGEYFFLASCEPDSVRLRLQKERLAAKRWKIAVVVSRVIARFPFVRGVFLSGELSKGVASEDGDIDYVVVTAERRLWIARTILILFKKTVLLNNKKYLCLNHFVAEGHLGVDEHNVYYAVELATLKPLWNSRILLEYLDRNLWIRTYLPNWTPEHDSLTAPVGKPSALQRLLELPFSGRMGDRLDNWLLSRWQAIWSRRYPELTEQQRDHMYRCRPFVSTAYGEDMLRKILDAYRSRLNRFGLA